MSLEAALRARAAASAIDASGASSGSSASSAPSASSASSADAELELDFSDVHGLWGGDRIVVRAMQLTVQSVPPSGRAPAGVRALAPGDLVRLAEALIAIEPWRPLEVAVDPHTGLPAPPIPDQSFASLAIRVGAEAAALHGPRDGRLAAAADRLVAWAKAVRGA